MSERIQKWDILKFFLMFTVVLAHFADYHTDRNEYMRSLFLFIYTFHIPLFVFISGLFSKRMINERRWDKMLGYLVLFFFAKAFFFAYNCILREQFVFSLFKEHGLAWFMFALFAFALITVGASKYKPQYVFAFSVLLALLAGYDPNVNTYLVLSRIIIFYPFYYAGYCLDPKKLEEFSRGKVKKVIAAVILIALAVFTLAARDLYFVRYMFTAQNPYSALDEYKNYGFLIRLACYAVSVIACTALIVLTPDKIGKGFIARRGQYTLPVFIFQYVIIFVCYHVFDFKEMLHNTKMLLLLFPISLAITLALSNKPLNTLTQKIAAIPQKARK